MLCHHVASQGDTHCHCVSLSGKGTVQTWVGLVTLARKSQVGTRSRQTQRGRSEEGCSDFPGQADAFRQRRTAPPMAGTGFLAQAVPGLTASIVMGSVYSAVTQWDTVNLSS